MFVISNGIRQVFRTPVKTALFLLLLALSTAFLSIGANLLFVSNKNMRAFEKSFKTIGTVRQKPNILQEVSKWDWGLEAYTYFNRPVYDSEIPLSVLDFEGANYVHAPEKRPYYGAYLENYDVSSYSGGDVLTILEAEPLEDCIPSGPVKMRIKSILSSDLGNYTGEIWFCDHVNENPAPMYVGKTYIMSVQPRPLSVHEGFDPNGKEYTPSLGIESTQYDKKGTRIPDKVAGDYLSFDEITEGYFDTPRGQRWLELVEVNKRLKQTLPVVATNATHLLMDFYNGNAYLTDGRDISAEEYSNGSKVCLVQRGFARKNDLEVGDILQLPLYYADYRRSASQVFYPNGVSFGFGQLNAEGKCYPVFEYGKYSIVGIYETSGGSYLISGFEAGNNMVVIPATSIENSDENNIVAYGPMQAYNTSFEIPNGTIDEFMKAWNQQGIDGLEIQFYDKGFSQLKDGLDRMRAVSMVLVAIGATVMLLVLTFFTSLFISKNKKRMAIERSLGLGRSMCVLSLLSGMLLLCVLGTTAGVGVGYLISGFIMELTTAAANKDVFNLLYSNWVNNADKVAEVRIDLQHVELNVLIVIMFVAITVSALIASIGVWRNLLIEPLTQLCTKDEE